MVNIGTIKNDGFRLNSQDKPLEDMAFISLKIALKAYFETYSSMSHALSSFINDTNRDQTQSDYNYSNRYNEAYTETIIHFHHFIELICKNFLRNEHALLVDSSDKTSILFKLLKGLPISDSELIITKSIEFAQTLDRLSTLIENNLISDSRLQFILEAKPWLNELNILRNRLLHRGIYILRYPALDNLICGYVLPFVMKITSLPEFQGLDRFWKYKALSCGIEPIDQLIEEVSTEPCDIGKIAYLKELGRASYMNPLSNSTYFKFEYKQKVKFIEESTKLYDTNVYRITSCPVCGLKALIVYDDVDGEYDETKNDGTYKTAWHLTWQVKCTCCSFKINNDLKNASEYGLPIEDYWFSEYLT
ncbi:MAG: hypothetical protein ABFD08_18700 [Syntrophomonas sp.]